MAAKKKTAKKKAAKKKAAPKISTKPKAEEPRAEPKKAKAKASTTPDTLVAGRTPENGWAVRCTETKEQGPERGDIGPALTAFLDGERVGDPVELHRAAPIAGLGSGFYREAVARL